MSDGLGDTGDGIVSFNLDIELEEFPVVIQRALDRGIAGGGLLAQQLRELGGDFPGFANSPPSAPKSAMFSMNFFSGIRSGRTLAWN